MDSTFGARVPTAGVVSAPALGRRWWAGAGDGAFTSYAGMDIGRDNGLVVDRAYEDRAPFAFTGTVKRVVFDLQPVHHEAAVALHRHAAVQAVADGAAG